MPDPTATSCVPANCPANMSGVYPNCSCNTGYVPNPAGGGCILPACPDHASRNSPNAPCACDAGYKFDATGTVCLEQFTLPQAETEKNGGQPQCGVGNPCNPANGNKYQAESDYAASEGVPQVIRYYNSMLTTKDYGLGFGWTWKSFGKLELYGNLVQVRAADGRGEPFTRNSAGQWIAEADSKLSLMQDASGYTLNRQDGSTERYDSTGKLLAQTGRNNRTTSYAYNGSGKLVSVTGPHGHALAIGYDSNGRIGSITDPAGGVYGYAYDGSGNLAQVTYPDGSIKRYHYENASFPHHLTGITDERGIRFATFAYDSTGKAIRTEHAVTGNGSPQERFSFAYDSDARTTVTDPIGNLEIMDFSVNLGVKNLTGKLNQGDGKTLARAFDADNNLICSKDENGNVTTYTYNTANQRLTTTEGQGGDCTAPAPTAATRTTTTQYLSNSLALPTVIESPSVVAGFSRRTEISYTNNLPAQITPRGYTPTGNPVSRTISLQYDGQGRVTRIDGPRTDVSDLTILTYNSCTGGNGCGQLKSLINALGQVTAYNSYDAHGRVTETTDPNGLKTNYAYDLRGRVLSVTQTSSGGIRRITQYQYDERGNLSRIASPDGRTLSYAYDAANDLTSVTDNLGNKIEYAYDLKGNRTRTLTKDSDGALARSLQTAYDLRNRIAEINDAGSISRQVSDALGNLTSTQDPSGNTTNYRYDSLNRLMQTVDALAGITSYGNGRNDRLARLTATNGAVTTYETDDLGNLLAEHSADRNTVTYTADEAGNVKTATDARNITAQYRYDALNRLIAIDYPGTEEDVAFTYDNGCSNGLGRLCKVQDPSGTTAYDYDGFGNVSRISRTELGTTYVTGYSYDLANRITAITYPDGRAVNYTRDAAGRISAAATTDRGATTALASGITRRADSLPTRIGYGNNLTETRTYSLKGELTGQQLTGRLLGDLTGSYLYDPVSNLMAERTTGAASPTLYTYDALDRLTDETGIFSGETGYRYDANGNRLALTGNGATINYRYATSSNRLTQTGNKDITLDAAGNTVSTDNGKWKFEYGYSGRMFKVYREGVWQATYRYNAQGQRTQKTTRQGTTVYHYDLSGHLIAETGQGGERQRAYVWLDDLPLAQIDRHGKGQEKSGRAVPVNETVAYLHTDQLGTPRMATDSSQQTVWRWDSDAFGAKSSSSDGDEIEDDSKITVNLRFPGQYFDKETRLHYNWNRYYDPGTGRYISSDPIGLEGGVNTYTYVGGNPLSYIDPFGLFEITVNDPGGRNGTTYGGTITVTGNNGQTVTVPASSWPNPSNPSPGVQPGSYTGTYSPTGHQGTTNGVRVNNGGQVPTMGPNPAQGGQSNATGINIHCGDSATNRGSAGCITVSPSSCQQVWSVLQPGETGTVQVNR